MKSLEDQLSLPTSSKILPEKGSPAVVDFPPITFHGTSIIQILHTAGVDAVSSDSNSLHSWSWLFSTPQIVRRMISQLELTFWAPGMVSENNCLTGVHFGSFRKVYKCFRRGYSLDRPSLLDLPETVAEDDSPSHVDFLWKMIQTLPEIDSLLWLDHACRKPPKVGSIRVLLELN